MENLELGGMTLSQIAVKNYKAAAVFEKYGLDYCCKGKRPLTEVCGEKGIDEKEVLSQITQISAVPAEQDFAGWGSGELIDYIVSTHHTYVRNAIPVIAPRLEKIAFKHGDTKPYMIEVKKTFDIVYKDLKQHMMKEEEILFPHIKYLAKLKRDGGRYESPYFGTVKNPVKMMEMEHQAAGDDMYAIRHLTNNYTIPEDACTTFRATIEELKAFEEDLHRHIHLENNILFPAAVELENLLSLK